VILRDRDTLGAVFSGIWNGNGQPTQPIADLKVRSWSDIVELSPGQTDRFHRLSADVDPAYLEDCDEVARDGIGLRLRSRGPSGDNVVRMRSPSATTNPAQFAWVSTMIDLAIESLPDSFAHKYLDDVRRYLVR
jgi:hypothetical protein